MGAKGLAKKGVDVGLRRFGFEMGRVPPTLKPGHSHVRPGATYSPWATDPEFRETYDTIADATLVDQYRCYELWQLTEQVADLQGSFIEIGVWRGGTGCLLAKRAQNLGIKNSVYLCDTFTGVVKAGDRDPDYNGGEHADASVEGVGRLAQRLGVSPQTLVGVFPEDTGEQIANEQFRLCHIDVDVYHSAHACLEWVFPRLASGGVVVFDDYGFRTCEGITDLVEEQRLLPDRLVVHNLNGHGLIVKR